MEQGPGLGSMGVLAGRVLGATPFPTIPPRHPPTDTTAASHTIMVKQGPWGYLAGKCSMAQARRQCAVAVGGRVEGPGRPQALCMQRHLCLPTCWRRLSLSKVRGCGCMMGRHQGGRTLLPGNFEGRHSSGERLDKSRIRARRRGCYPCEQMLVCMQHLSCYMLVDVEVHA